ncbi:MAG: hypothetical protein JF886_04650 [Candidatus Dormibacteraeota bacterium]|uniref:Glycosyltransferase RgtA/B/C/D-like domain-containing protein n=1 Tax=Candidatus Aeolococcus gillhamiae TaxID=3127015 RepID=A0A934JUF5_9BACT|nr:hypothetical protein [Candidatus Dormibacteraeota bacterium]
MLSRLTPAVIRQLLIGLFLVFCFGYFHQAPIWNEPSRYDLVVALVDDHTTQIDRNQANTGDKSVYKGHYYSDKEPGTAFLGAPVYGVMRLIRLVTHQPAADEGVTIQVLAFVICGIPTALLAILLIRFLGPLVGEWWAIVVALAYALGTMAFPFATMFFGHAAAAFFLFAAFYLLRHVESPGRRWLPALAGFCAGWAVLVDVSTAIGLMAMAAYAVRPLFRPPVLANFRRPLLNNLRRPLLPALRTPLLFAAGVAPLAVLLLLYNWVSFGGPFSIGYAHLANGGFAAGQSKGILGVTLPRPGAIADLLFGTRGLLRYSPWLALAPAGLWAARGRGLRWEVGVCATLVGAYLLLNGGYFLPFGGATPGPRFLMPMLPFAAVLVGLAPRVLRYAAAVLMVPSVALTSVATVTMPNAFEGVANPLTDLWLPMLRGRLLTETTGWVRWGLHGAQPLLVLGFGGVCTGVGVWATTTTARTARRVGAGAGVVLGILVASLGTPLDVPSEVGLTTAGRFIGFGDAGAGVTIIDTGVSGVVTADRHTSVRPWAQVEGRDLGAVATRVLFTIFDASGRSVLGVFYDHVSFGSHERKMLPVEWGTQGVPAGKYTLDVSVTSADGHTVYATVTHADEFTIHARA